MTAALQTPRTRLIPLSRQITELLRLGRGKRFSSEQIAERLGLQTGNTGQGWHNAASLAFELAKLCEFQKISYASSPDFTYWIEPPRDEVRP